MRIDIKSDHVDDSQLDHVAKSFKMFWEQPVSVLFNNFLHIDDKDAEASIPARERAFYDLTERLTCVTIEDYEFVQRQIIEFTKELTATGELTPSKWLLLAMTAEYGVGRDKDLVKMEEFYRNAIAGAKKNSDDKFSNYIILFAYHQMARSLEPKAGREYSDESLRQDAAHEDLFVNRNRAAYCIQESALYSFYVGEIYNKDARARGMEINRDVKDRIPLAIQYFKKASERGYAEAFRKLAWINLHSGKDPAWINLYSGQHDYLAKAGRQTIDYFGKAVALGRAHAFEDLCTFLHKGDGFLIKIEQDYVLALQYMQTLATVVIENRIRPKDQGYSAESMIGEMFEKGKGVEKDTARAIQAYEKLPQGFILAKVKVFKYFWENKNEDKLANSCKYIAKITSSDKNRQKLKFWLEYENLFNFNNIMENLFKTYPNNSAIIFYVELALTNVHKTYPPCREAYNALCKNSPDDFDRLAIDWVSKQPPGFPKKIDFTSPLFKKILRSLDEKPRHNFVARMKLREARKAEAEQTLENYLPSGPVKLIGGYIGLSFFEEKGVLAIPEQTDQEEKLKILT